MPENNDNNPSSDKKVKDLLDSAARGDLERWFGLPSFEALSERGVEAQPPPEDPQFVARRKRQEEALAAVDPALVERHRRRIDAMSQAITPLPPVPLRINANLARFDAGMAEQRTVSEPREVERPGDLEDALAERTPQALLRDLHRPELDFHKRFEWVDPVGEARVDVAASVSEMMKTSMKLPAFEALPFQQGHALLLELRAERRQPWTSIEMPLRRVTE